MANVVDIIVLDDDDGEDEETPSCSPKEKKSPSEPSPPPPPPPPAPPSEPESSKKKDGGSSQSKTSMSAENQKLFEEFVEYCSKLTVEHPEVITFLQSRFSKANASYLSSVEFRNTLGRCLTRVQSKQTKVYVYINELCTVLKNHSEKKKVSLQTRPATPQRDKVEADHPGPVEEAEEEVPEKKAASKHQIRRLENLLRLYSQEIQKLQERELTLDDMADEDSTYIQESRLKQKMLRIFEKLCELKECSSLTGRVIEQRIQYKGTRYQEVNRRLEKFINKTRDIFPDYGDILQVVQKANERHNLGLTRKQIQGIAQDAFRDLGNKLQYRRHLDMVYNFGSHLTDSYKNGLDPAEHDPSLARRLRENRNTAKSSLEDVIKKFADMQDEGEEEEWKNKDKDDEMPSTSKGVKDSPRSRKTESSKSDESEEDEDEEEDEESEESDVDIEEELRQSQEADDGDEDEEIPVEYSNETDQKMEETSDPQSSSPAGKEEAENEMESDNSDQDEDGDGDDGEKDGDNEVKDGETGADDGEGGADDGDGDADDGDGDADDGEEMEEEGTDKDEDQVLSSTSTPLSLEKEDTTSLGFEVENAEPASSGDSNDSQQDNKTQEDHTEPDNMSETSSVTSIEADSRADPLEHLEMTVVEEDFVEVDKNNTEKVNVPYVEAGMPSSKEQDTKKCPDIKIKLEKDSKSPMTKGKVGNSSRLDKCISKLTGGLTHKVPTGTEEGPSAGSDEESFSHVNNKNLGSGGTPRTGKQSRKLVCGDPPAERWDSVRKVAFSHSRSTDENSDVVHLDSCRNSTLSNSSNGVHREVVRASTPINRLKRKRDLNTPPDPVFTVKVEELGSHRRKRKASSQLWTGNGVAKYNGEENGNQQKLKHAKLSSSSYTSYSSPSEPCSDNEHDLTLDLMVTCSPQMNPSKTPSPQNKTDAATQCDPDEVIVLSD